MKYQYAAVDVRGKKKRGQLEAESEAEVVALLREQQLVPTEINLAGMLANGKNASGEKAKSFLEVELFEQDSHKAKFPARKLIVTFTQMSIMLRAGVSLSMALEVLADGESNGPLRKVLREMHEDLLAGISLSDSMGKFACFDVISVNLVRSGEADGHLERSFAQISQICEKQNALRSKIVNASIYPIILLILIVVVLAVINAVVMPNFITMFDMLGTGLPVPTQVVMAISDFCNKWWWLMALAVLALCVGYSALHRKNHKFAYGVDRFMLYIPIVGNLIKQSAVARFSRIVGTLLGSGQDFLSALHIGRSVIANTCMRDGFGAAAEDVRVGNPISVSLGKLPFLDGVYVSMLRAGEESGSLSDTLEKMADLYDEQTDATSKRLTTMMEPAMTLVVAVIVGGVMLAIVPALFGTLQLVGNV